MGMTFLNTSIVFNVTRPVHGYFSYVSTLLRKCYPLTSPNPLLATVLCTCSTVKREGELSWGIRELSLYAFEEVQKERCHKV